MPANLENSAVSVFFQIPKKGIAKELSNYCKIGLISLAKYCSKLFKPSFNNV